MKMSLRIVFLGVMAVVLIAPSANAELIVAENFSGDGSGGLAGTPADTFSPAITAAGGSGTWGAGSGFLDDGSVSVNRQAAYLNLGTYIEDMKGSDEALFELTLTVSETAGAWISLGFGIQNTPDIDKDFTNASSVGATGTTQGLGTIVYRASGELDMFVGPGSSVNVDGPDGNTGDRTLTVTWDFTPAGGYGSSNFGKVTWSDSALGELGSYSLSAAKTFGSILITGATNSAGTISNLRLTQLGKLGAAHTPNPSNGADMVDPAISSVSWYSPEQDENGDPFDDPNISSVVGYDVYFGTTEPNDLIDTPDYQTGQSYPVTLAYDTTYYWRVDSYVNWTAGGSSVVEGPVWQFTTTPAYFPPVLTFNNVITTLDLLPAELSAAITDNSDPMTSPVFTLLTDDPEFPIGADATLTDTTTVDNQNPTATLDTDMAGTYKVSLEVSDGTTTLEEIAEVVVYADACEAQKNAPSGWTADHFDTNGDCIVNLVDLADMADEWLNETSMTSQETYEGDVFFIVPVVIESFDDVVDWQWVWNSGSAYGSQSVSAVADPSGERAGLVVKYDYDNSGPDGSDVTLPLEAGTVDLSQYDRMTLWYKCAPGNSLETKLYLSIIEDNNDGDPDNDSSAQIQIRDTDGSTQSPSPGEWLKWTIDLNTDLQYGGYSTSGAESLADITNFNTLLIGSWSSGVGGTGTIYFDSLELIDLPD